MFAIIYKHTHHVHIHSVVKVIDKRVCLSTVRSTCHNRLNCQLLCKNESYMKMSVFSSEILLACCQLYLIYSIFLPLILRIFPKLSLLLTVFLLLKSLIWLSDFSKQIQCGSETMPKFTDIKLK